MENLSKRLVDKSIEAFIMGLEIYNKPTIRYRIEGFSFFICNAWELMLKAELLNKNISIYYPNSDRTISLEKTIQKIYTDKKQPLRINLEKIIELRNTSTHFITEEYEIIYAPFFQSCVLNFSEQIKRFHNVDVTRYISQNFLTLTVSLNILSNEEIRGKYSQEMAERLISNKNELEFLEANNSSNDLYIPIRHEFVQIKDKNKADFTYAIDPTSDVAAKIITKLQDPKDKYKLSRKNVIDSINKQIKTKNITFNYRAVSGDASFNEYTLNLIMDYYNLKDNQKYCYRFVNTKRYSQQLVEFVVEKIKSDSDLIKHLRQNKKR
ncbi:DUF3644 domain-containing protein [Limosilactobacillus fermentum]